MENKSYSVTYLVDKSPTEVFTSIIDVRKWWSGLYGEQIEGQSARLGDEFMFRAGDGVHYSKQQLIELVPDQKVMWLVTDSSLSFVERKNEWTGTKLSFDISAKGKKTEVTFTHIGLVPEIECYDGCSNAWTAYLQKFLSPDSAGRNIINKKQVK